MPEMTLLGWFHTILGILAVLSGFYTIYKFKVISYEVSPGKLYVLVTTSRYSTFVILNWFVIDSFSSYPECFKWNS